MSGDEGGRGADWTRWDDDGGGVKGNGGTLLVGGFVVVVGVCVGLNPHISHCRCAPVRV